MKYSLRQLEVFLATAHYGNVSRAAEQLSMSQSAASSALKELEQQFDMQLFDRIGKRLQLNAFGHSVRPKAEALMEQAQDLQSVFVQHGSDNMMGSLKVGTTMTIGHDAAIDIINQFKVLHPNTKVSLDISNTANIAQSVENYELDIGMIEGELYHPQLETINWREDELVVFCHAQHPLAKKQADGLLVTDEDLIAYEWVVREQGSGTRQTFERAMHDLLPHLTISLELQLVSAVKQAVAKNLGVGCLSSLSLKEEFENGTFVQLHIPERNFERHFYFILHKQKYQSEDLKRWLELSKNF